MTANITGLSVFKREGKGEDADCGSEGRGFKPRLPPHLSHLADRRMTNLAIRGVLSFLGLGSTRVPAFCTTKPEITAPPPTVSHGDLELHWDERDPLRSGDFPTQPFVPRFWPRKGHLFRHEFGCHLFGTEQDLGIQNNGVSRLHFFLS